MFGAVTIESRLDRSGDDEDFTRQDSTKHRRSYRSDRDNGDDGFSDDGARSRPESLTAGGEKLSDPQGGEKLSDQQVGEGAEQGRKPAAG